MFTVKQVVFNRGVTGTPDGRISSGAVAVNAWRTSVNSTSHLRS